MDCMANDAHLHRIVVKIERDIQIIIEKLMYIEEKIKSLQKRLDDVEKKELGDMFEYSDQVY